MTPRNERAFKKNEGPVPKAAIRRPERPGPISRAALKFAELRLTALGKSSFPTTSLVNACLTVASRADASPSVNEIAHDQDSERERGEKTAEIAVDEYQAFVELVSHLPAVHREEEGGKEL